MQDWLLERVQVTPNKTALFFREQSWTYSELNALVDQFSTNLVKLDIQQGQFVAVLMPNNWEYVVLIHALARIGAVLIPLNTRLTPNELQWQLNHTQCTTLIYSDEMVDVIQPFRQYIHVISIEALKKNTSTIITAFHFEIESLQAIVFTSGTTGNPKGVMLTFSNHFWSAVASAFRLGLSTEDRWLSCLPLYHVGGLAVIFRSCLYGTAIDLYAKFDLEPIHGALQNQPITLISLVPTMLYRLLQAKGTTQWMGTLRMVLLGGAAATPELIQNCQEHGVKLATTYGLTEASSQVATMLPHDVEQKIGSVGKPLLFTSIRIVAENGTTLPNGEYGEIVVSGKTIMQGYYDNREATANTLKNGKLYTGDIGYLDADGDLWLVQRRSDLIVSGGENIYPAEVEKVFSQHPAISDICVVGITHPEWGQQVVAMIVLKNDATITEESLLTFGREYLAGYKLPRFIQFVESLPQTASGKVHRKAVEKKLRVMSDE